MPSAPLTSRNGNGRPHVAYGPSRPDSAVRGFQVLELARSCGARSFQALDGGSRVAGSAVRADLGPRVAPTASHGRARSGWLRSGGHDCRAARPVPHRPRPHRHGGGRRRTWPPRPGSHVLHLGGNAVDAAIATNAVHGRHQPAHVRHGRRPLRPRPHAGRRRARRPERVRPRRLRRRPRPPPRRGPRHHAVPRRHPLGARARLRRRLVRPPPALRPPAAGRDPGPRHRLRRGRLPGVAPPRREPGRACPRTTTGALGRAARAGPAAPATSWCARASPGRCGPSPPAGATRSTAASSAPASSPSAPASTPPTTSPAARPTG